MSEFEMRPKVGIAHVYLQTDRMKMSGLFFCTIGMRPIFESSDVSIYEMRSGTHLILTFAETIIAGDAPFDLMVDDLPETHKRLTALGLSPSFIESFPEIDHEIFKVREPAGHIIKFFSSHASGKPI